MGIGQIQFGSVQNLGRHDIGEPLREGDAIARQYDPIRKFGTEAEGIGRGVQDEITQQEVQDASVQLSYRLMDLEQQNGGKAVFKREELPDYLTEGKTVKKEVAPGVFEDVPVAEFQAHEVYPDFFKDRANAALVEESSKIRDPKARQEFFDKFGLSIEEKATSLVLKAGETRKAAFKAQTIQRATEAMDRGNFGIAAEVVKSSSDLTEPEKIQLLDKIGTTQEASIYEGMMLRNDVKGMRTAIKNLQAKEYNGVFSMEQRNNYASQLERELHRIDTEAKANLAGVREVLKYEIGKVTGAIEAGIPVSPAVIADLQKRSRGVLDAGDQYKFADVVRTQGLSAKFASRPASERARILADFSNRPNGLTADEANLLNTFSKVDQTLRTQERSDLMGLAAQRGVVKVEPVEINTKDNALANSLAKRFQAFKAAQSVWGPTGSGPLMAGEAETLKDILADPKGGINKQLEVFRQVSLGFKGDTQTIKLFYDQLKEKGLGHLAVAGGLYATGNEKGAREVLEGARLVKEKAVTIKNEQEQQRVVSEALGGLYAHDPEKRAALVQSALMAHVGRQARGNDLSGEKTRSLKDIALELSGAVTYKKATIAAPPGVKPDTFKRWLETEGSTPEYLDALGQFAVKGAAPKVAEGLRGGSYKLMSAGDNEYLIVAESGAFLQGADGAPFIYRFDPEVNARARSAAAATKKIDQSARRKLMIEEGRR